jgi:hypothetical protein
MNDATTFGQLLAAWQEWVEPNPAWDRYGLHLLAAADLLDLEPEYGASTVPPRGDLIGLIEALAARLDAVVADPSRPVAVRLTHDAAASELRRAIGALR